MGEEQEDDYYAVAQSNRRGLPGYGSETLHSASEAGRQCGPRACETSA